MDNFQDQVPRTATFDLGTLKGNSVKIWPKGGNVFLWCDGASETGAESYCSTKEAESAGTKHSQQVAEIESIYKELKENIKICVIHLI